MYISFRNYWDTAKQYFKYLPEHAELCTRLGFFAEIGEIVQLIEKSVRNGEPVDLARFKDEVGDAVWFFCANRTAINPDDLLQRLYIADSLDHYGDTLYGESVTVLEFAEIIASSVFVREKITVTRNCMSAVLALAEYLGISVDDCLNYNLEKLCKRHAS